MKIAIVGTGHVGLVTGTCLADHGHQVSCLDVDGARMEQLSQGKFPLYEPGLQEMGLRNAAAGRLHFTTRFDEAIVSADLVFLAVDSPSAEDVRAEPAAIGRAIDQIAPLLATDAQVVIKSTVPVGTNAATRARLQRQTGRDIAVVSNPDFLKEGTAVHDCLFPARIVVGARELAEADRLRELYAPFLRTDHPLLVMSPESAELTKFAANALLGMRISFINEVANLCEALDADIDDVRRGMGHDPRIGFAGMFPGIGFGGSGLPSDVRHLAATARAEGLEPLMLDATAEVNDRQRAVLCTKIRAHFGDALSEKTIAAWGVSFKPRTDDVREAPALALIDQLLDAGAQVCVHDPVALPNVRDIYRDRLRYAVHPLDVLVGADALVIHTEWGEYRNPDFAAMLQRMASPVIFDGRNLYAPDVVAAAGFTYYSVGRPTAPS